MEGSFTELLHPKLCQGWGLGWKVVQAKGNRVDWRPGGQEQWACTRETPVWLPALLGQGFIRDWSALRIGCHDGSPFTQTGRASQDMPGSSKYEAIFTFKCWIGYWIGYWIQYWILDSLVLIFHVSLFSNLMISPWLLIRTTQEAFKKMPRPPRRFWFNWSGVNPGHLDAGDSHD